MKYASIITIAIIIMLVISASTGYKRGAYSSLKWAIGVVLGFAFASIFRSKLTAFFISKGAANFLQSSGSFGQIGNQLIIPLLSGISFVIIMFLSKWGIGMLLKEPPQGGILSIVNSLTGAILGILEVCVVIWLVNYSLRYANLPIINQLKSIIYSSALFKFLAELSPF